MRRIFQFYTKVVRILSIPIILREYFSKQTGEDYGVGLRAKFFLALRMRRNTRKIISGSHFLEHLVMATNILKIPKSIEGCVVECGSYKGASTANLSLVCAFCNRRLEVFDSFEGLPEPLGHDKAHICLSTKEVHTYTKGAWSGSLEEVRRNITDYGEIKVCNFNVGYFERTLQGFGKKCVFVFADVDLRSSLECCVNHLWPVLQDGCSFYVHEAHHMEIASLFFDREWWRKNCDSNPPGLVGAGNGLGLDPDSGGFKSALGFTLKNPNVVGLREVQQTGV